MNISILVRTTALLTLLYAWAYGSSPRTPGGAKYALEVSDQQEKARFLLILTSKDKRTICISRVAWPDREGATQTGRFVYSLQTEKGIIFPHAPKVESDCWGADCEIRIPPGGSIAGFISYSEFGSPVDIARLRKRELHVDIVPSLCE